MAYVVVRDSGDMQIRSLKGETFGVIRGIFKTREAAQAWVQTIWDNGERPQARIESYFLRDS
jgi:hypothetical protein